MKVLMINGSPKANGNTAFALSQMAEVFAENGVEYDRETVIQREIYLDGKFSLIRHISEYMYLYFLQIELCYCRNKEGFHAQFL